MAGTITAGEEGAKIKLRKWRIKSFCGRENNPKIIAVDNRIW
jgi:hypothetical protein